MPVLTGAGYVEAVAQALDSLRTHPLRASLASVAMAAAVATTAVVQTGLNGLERSTREAGARAFGSDSFVIAKVAGLSLSRREFAERVARNPNITRGDVRFLDRVANDRVLYAATVQRQADVSAAGRTFESASINGVQSTMFDIRDVGIAQGRAIGRDDELSGAQVIVAGHAVADELFSGDQALGRTVRISGRGFRIVGVQASQGSAGGVSLDRYVWMPIGAFERTFGAQSSVQVFARATDVSRTDAAEDHARVSMRARRHLSPAAPDTFEVITPEASRSFVASLTARIGAAAPPISLMALLAAVVVVANTTLVSVSERTREIGIRRAVGATRTNVLVETLAESSLVALAGGLVGLGAAAGVLSFASGLLDIPLSLNLPTALGSLAAAGLSGAVAGWYPARRAAAFDVSDALRQE
jgi:putative ABC transport system permease protein